MTMTAKQTALLKDLKKKIHVLQRKEAQTRQKMRVALGRAEKMGMFYKRKLERNAIELQRKLKAAQSSSYARAISDIEKRIKKQLRSKAKSLVDLFCRIEKKRTAKSKKVKRKH